MLEALIEIVRRAGNMVLSAHDIQNVTREKHGPADLVTQYDEAVQAFLRRELLRLLPEADFFGEEGEHPALTRPWVFVVDPIDGTTNFTRRMNYSSISVALVHNGQTEYGVVYNPYVGELFAARRGHGATLNGAPIHVSGNDVPHAIVVCGSTIYDRTYTDWTTGALPRRPWTAARSRQAGRRSSSSAACPPGTMPPGRSSPRRPEPPPPAWRAAPWTRSTPGRCSSPTACATASSPNSSSKDEKLSAKGAALC